MATEVFTTESIILLDGEEVELKPCSIFNLRKVMRLWSECISEMGKKWNEAAEAVDGDPTKIDAPLVNSEVNDLQFDAWLKMCAICLDEYKGERSEKAYLTHLEKTLDEHSIYRILKKCANLNMQKGDEEDPNLRTAEMNPELVGTN